MGRIQTVGSAANFSEWKQKSEDRIVKNINVPESEMTNTENKLSFS